MIQQCHHCESKVLAKADGSCPSCKELISEKPEIAQTANYNPPSQATKPIDTVDTEYQKVKIAEPKRISQWYPKYLTLLLIVVFGVAFYIIDYTMLRIYLVFTELVLLLVLYAVPRYEKFPPYSLSEFAKFNAGDATLSIPVHRSRIGPVIDLARNRSYSKPLVRSSFEFCLAGGIFLAATATPSGFVISIPLACFFFAGFVRQIGRLWDRDCYIRVGPEGITLCTPGRPIFSLLMLSYHHQEEDIPWSEFVNCIQYTYKTKGIFNDMIFLDKANGQKLAIDTVQFAEPAGKIAGQIVETYNFAVGYA